MCLFKIRVPECEKCLGHLNIGHRIQLKRKSSHESLLESKNFVLTKNLKRYSRYSTLDYLRS